MTFTVITDCNSLRATQNKEHILPRIARWWLQLQEFTFDVKYRPGERMKHVDALSRYPGVNEQIEIELVMHIDQADWVLTGQLTDGTLQEVHRILSKIPITEYEKHLSELCFTRRKNISNNRARVTVGRSPRYAASNYKSFP